jgi:hypothetical protein
VNVKHQEGIVVNFTADHIDDRSQMLARNSPVGAGALHLEIGPLTRKHLQPLFFSDGQYFRVELAVEQFRYQYWSLNKAIHQGFYLFIKKGGYDDGNVVRAGATSSDFGSNVVAFDLYIFYVTASCVGGSSR